MLTRRSSGCPSWLSASVLAVSLAFSSASAQNANPQAIASLHPAAQANRIARSADLAPRIQLSGHVPAWASAARQIATPVDLTESVRITLVLQRDPAVEAAFTQLLADQQNPASPLFHQWLTPQQIGALYGPTQSDLDAITAWATAQGLTLAAVQPSRIFLDFTGSLATVAGAFHTSFAYFNSGSSPRLSAISEPSIPQAFAGVLRSIQGLSQNRYAPQSRMSQRLLPSTGLKPDVTFSDGSHYLLPNDFAAIYDLSSVYTGGNLGATIGPKAQHIAIIGRSRVAAADITNFESLAGLSNIQPNVVLAGGDPGTSNVDDEGEATLDVDRVFGTAPGAIADLVISASTHTQDGVDIAIAYNINTLVDPIMSISFGSCEVENGSSETNSLDAQFQNAAAEGISTFISSGDSGAAGCEQSFASPVPPQVASINALCASSYVTCVGGTEFNDTANPSAYWSSQNTQPGNESALGYIPEGAWNESAESTTYQIAGTGGGESLYIAKPSWQTGTGVPADGHRDVPDVALSAADHDGYVGCFAKSGATCISTSQGVPITIFSGTSAAAPAMAAIGALINTKYGVAQGNMNPLFYSIATSSPSSFHDATIASSGVTNCSVATPSICNNSTPGSSSSLTGGQAGFDLTTGFDESTGLGSPDVAKLLTASVITTVSTSLAVTASPNPAVVNGSVTLTAALTNGTSTKTPSGTVQFYSNGVVVGSAATLSSNTATLNTSFTTAGTYAITAIYSGDSNFSASTAAAYSLVVNAPSFTVTPATTTYSLISGAATGNTDNLTVTSLNSFAGTVVLGCTVTNTSGNAAGSCAITPSSDALTAGSTSNSTLTITTTAGTSGVLTVAVAGTSGSTTISAAPITVNLTASAFTLTASPSGIPTTGTLTSGSTVTSIISVTSTNAFAGTVALTCAAANQQTSGTAAGSCSVSPASVTLTSGSTVTTVATIVTTAGTSGVLTATITGTGRTANSAIATTASTQVAVTVVTPGFVVTPATASLSLVSGATTGNTAALTVTSTNGFAGTVTLTCAPTTTSGTAAGSCSATPVTLTSGSSATSTVTLTSTPGTAGVLSLAIGAASGSIAATAPTPVITATLIASGFTLAAPSLSFTSGATSANVDTVTLTSVNGFAGSVALTCSISASSAAFQPTCKVVSPVTLTAGGTATSTVTITSTTAQDRSTIQQFARLERRFTFGGGAVLASLLILPAFRRRRNLRALATLALMACGIAVISGCGSGSTPVQKSSAGSYTVTVSGSGTTAGSSIAASASTTFSLTIQ